MFRLPPEVVGTSIMTMIGLIDVVHLDSAACSHKCRRELLIIFSATLPIDLHDLNDPSRYNGNHIVWNWFWKRNMTIKAIEIRANLQGIEDLNRYIHLVVQPINICCGRDDDDYSDLALVYAKGLSNFPCVVKNIDGITLARDVAVNDLLELIPRMPSLASIVDDTAYLSEDDLLQLLLFPLPLTKLCIKTDMNYTLLQAILPMGDTLRSLEIYSTNLQEEHYQLIAQHCPHLTCFFLGSGGSMNLPRPYEGVTAILMGCRELQDVHVTDFSDSDAFLLLYATHCPELRITGSSNCTDAALDALSRRCPHLVELHGTAWDVDSMETITLASSWLARLTTLSLVDSYAPTQGTMGALLPHLRDVEVLHLMSRVYFGAAELDMLATRCCRLRELSLMVSGEDSATASIAAIARSNPHLESITLDGDMPMTDVVLVEAAQGCPKLRVLVCASDRHPDKVYRNKVTDCAMVQLARGCPKLRRLDGCSSTSLTDVSVFALAAHCRHLELADFRDAAAVTIGALEALVEHTAVDWEGIRVDQYYLRMGVAARIREQAKVEEEGSLL